MPNQSTEYSLIEANTQRIERLVFSGGGARGVVYSGAYAALEETGVFRDVKEIAGSSAGAITAALLAVGMTAETFQKELSNTNLSTLLGKRSKGALFERTGEPLYRFIKKHINESIFTILSKKENLNPDCLNILDKLTKPAEALAHASITFTDLDVLRKAFPEHFKGLTVTAVKVPTGNLKLHNVSDTPNVEIARACQASGALPGVFSPVSISNEQYVDGGIFDNIPTDFFDKKSDGTYINNEQTKTLVFAFIEGTPNKKRSVFAIILAFFDWSNLFSWRKIFTTPAVFNALYGSRMDESSENHTAPVLFRPNFFESLGRNYLIPFFSKLQLNYKQTDKRESGFQKIRSKYPLRTVGLNVEDLLAIDFSRATETSSFMHTCGYLDTIDMIFNHELHRIENHDKKFDAKYSEKFYAKIVNDFIKLYEASLRAVKKDPATDALLKELMFKSDSNPELSILSKYYLIKAKTEKSPKSLCSRVLSNALEYRHKKTSELDEFIKALVNKNNPSNGDTNIPKIPTL